MAAPKTREFLGQVLIQDLVSEIILFLIPPPDESVGNYGNLRGVQVEKVPDDMFINCTDFEIARLNGLAEMVDNITNYNICLHGACEGGHMKLVKLALEHGAQSFNHGLYGSCKGGHLDIAELMIEKGATIISMAINGALINKHYLMASILNSKHTGQIAPKFQR